MTMAEALQTLGLQRPVTRGSIKKAFREKSKLHHPDTGGNADTFLKIKTAYDLLAKKTDGELNYTSSTPLQRSPNRGELIITDFPFLVFLEKVLSKYYHWKRKPVSGFLLRRFSRLIRYFFTNPRHSSFRKWVQLLAMIVASVTVFPLLLALLIVSWPFFLLGRFVVGKVRRNQK